MFQKIDNNVAYVLKQKTPNIIKKWLISLLILLIIIVVIFIKYNYYKSDDYIGQIKVDKLYIYIEYDKINLLNNSKILINNTEYSFSIHSISEEYYLIDNKKCYLVGLNISLEEKYIIENNILNVTLKYYKTTVLKEIKKGLIKWKN